MGSEVAKEGTVAQHVVDGGEDRCGDRDGSLFWSAPSVLLKLYIYGYLNRVQSSRRLEHEAGRNVEVMWLTGRLAPDHKTIADFRKDNGTAIRKVCARFVALCRTMGLLTQASVAIDGSKFKAVNNRDKNFTRAKMERRMAQIEESVARYLQQLDSADRQEPSEALKTKTSRLKEKIEKLKEQMRRLDGSQGANARNAGPAADLAGALWRNGRRLRPQPAGRSAERLKRSIRASGPARPKGARRDFRRWTGRLTAPCPCLGIWS